MANWSNIKFKIHSVLYKLKLDLISTMENFIVEEMMILIIQSSIFLIFFYLLIKYNISKGVFLCVWSYDPSV